MILIVPRVAQTLRRLSMIDQFAIPKAIQVQLNLWTERVRIVNCVLAKLTQSVCIKFDCRAWSVLFALSPRT